MIDLKAALDAGDRVIPIDHQDEYAHHAHRILTSIKAMERLIEAGPETADAAVTGTVIGACLQNMISMGMTKGNIMSMLSDMLDVIVFEVTADEIKGTSKPN